MASRAIRNTVVGVVVCVVLLGSVRPARAESNSWYEDAKSIIIDVIRQSVGKKLHEKLNKRPELAFYLEEPLKQMKSDYWGGLPTALKQSAILVAGDFAYWLASEGKLDGFSQAMRTFFGKVHAHYKLDRSKSYMEKHCEAPSAKNGSWVACGAAKAAVAFLRGQPKTAKLHIEEVFAGLVLPFVQKAVGGDATNLRYSLRAWIHDIDQFKQDIRSYLQALQGLAVPRDRICPKSDAEFADAIEAEQSHLLLCNPDAYDYKLINPRRESARLDYKRQLVTLHLRQATRLEQQFRNQAKAHSARIGRLSFAARQLAAKARAIQRKADAEADPATKKKLLNEAANLQTNLRTTQSQITQLETQRNKLTKRALGQKARAAELTQQEQDLRTRRESFNTLGRQHANKCKLVYGSAARWVDCAKANRFKRKTVRLSKQTETVRRQLTRFGLKADITGVDGIDKIHQLLRRVEVVLLAWNKDEVSFSVITKMLGAFGKFLEHDAMKRILGAKLAGHASFVVKALSSNPRLIAERALSYALEHKLAEPLEKLGALARKIGADPTLAQKFPAVATALQARQLDRTVLAKALAELREKRPAGLGELLALAVSICKHHDTCADKAGKPLLALAQLAASGGVSINMAQARKILTASADRVHAMIDQLKQAGVAKPARRAVDILLMVPTEVAALQKTTKVDVLTLLAKRDRATLATLGAALLKHMSADELAALKAAFEGLGDDLKKLVPDVDVAALYRAIAASLATMRKKLGKSFAHVMAAVASMPSITATLSILDAIQDGGNFRRLVSMVQKKQFYRFAADALAAALSRTSLNKHYATFLVNFTTYALVVRQNENGKTVAREAFRAAAVDLLRTLGAGFPTEKRVHCWPLFSSVGLRYAFSKHYINEEGRDGLRLVVSTPMLTVLRRPITDNLGVELSFLDPGAALSSYALRPTGKYKSSGLIWLDMIRPRVDFWLGVPEFSRRVAFSFGASFRPIALKRREGGSEDSYRYVTALDGVDNPGCTLFCESSIELSAGLSYYF